MTEMFSVDNLIMFSIILFSSFFVFLFNYRHDNKDKYQGNWWLICLDLFINMGMSVTGYILIVLVFDNVQQVQPYASFKREYSDHTQNVCTTITIKTENSI